MLVRSRFAPRLSRKIKGAHVRSRKPPLVLSVSFNYAKCVFGSYDVMQCLYSYPLR